MKLDQDTLDMLRISLHALMREGHNESFVRRLEELGWEEVLKVDAATALRVLFEIKGETLSSVDALGPELVRVASLTDPSVGPNHSILLPSPLSNPGTSGDTVKVEGVTSATNLGSQVIFFTGEQLSTCASSHLTISPLQGTDDSANRRLVHGEVPIASVARLSTEASTAVVAAGRRMIAAELVGIGRHVVASAVEYTAQRVQYGKPIGVFQALQHRLASAHCLVVGAGNLATEAAEQGDEWTALVAKCLAGRAAENACTQVQQCYGAIGFTWEHEFHRYLRRVYILDREFGDWRTLEHEIGDRLQATRVVPRIGAL